MIKPRNTKPSLTHTHTITITSAQWPHHSFCFVATRRKLEIKVFFVLRKPCFAFIWNKHISTILMLYYYYISFLLFLLLSSFQNTSYAIFPVFHVYNIVHLIKTQFYTTAAANWCWVSLPHQSSWRGTAHILASSPSLSSKTYCARQKTKDFVEFILWCPKFIINFSTYVKHMCCKVL